MTEVEAAKEDLLIRRILIGTGVSLVAGVLATIVIVTVFISSNFNIFNWLE